MLAACLLFAPVAAAAPSEDFLHQSTNTVLVAEKKTAKTAKSGHGEEQVYTATVTAYNTVEAQTDASPCVAAGGYICGRRDVVACPRHIPLHTWVTIEGKTYECMDRTAPKYDHRFDISCDKDMACPYRITGVKKVIVH